MVRSKTAPSLLLASVVAVNSVEPLAELFSDLDAAIDSRADDHEQKEKDPGFGGFHRIEYELYAQGSTKEAEPFADKLMTDVKDLQGRITGLTVEPKVMAGGISQAMISTVLGLIIAIPILFINSVLAARSRILVQILDEQSAGMLAARLEQQHVR